MNSKKHIALSSPTLKEKKSMYVNFICIFFLFLRCKMCNYGETWLFKTPFRLPRYSFMFNCVADFSLLSDYMYLLQIKTNKLFLNNLDLVIVKFIKLLVVYCCKTCFYFSGSFLVNVLGTLTNIIKVHASLTNSYV
ncbi:hypothetical protein ACJIZ3_023848 [Penstemon smallii]|uniref:Uncharacterized protein n=1 Tax=Penstemon smallii TaxID=265156 RepID=A0ABD3TSI6_9LAMI